ACFFSEQVLDVISTAHARRSDLLVEKTMGHRRNAYGCGGTTVLTKEVGLRSPFRAGLLRCCWQPQWRQAGALTNKHFNVVTIGHTRLCRLFLLAMGGQARSS